MGAGLAVTAVKTVGIKNIGKVILGLVLLLIAAVAVPIGVPIAVIAAVAAPGNSQADGPPGGAFVVGDWGKPETTYSIGRGFGLDPNACSFCSTNHKGIDLGHGRGTHIYAAGPGTVTHAGRYGGYGNAVVIDHGGNLISLYGHMGYGTLTVRVGDTVKAGIQIGQEGSTGNSTGPHVHFELRKSGVAFDPEPFMARRGLPL